MNLIVGDDAVIAWFMRPQVPYNIFTNGADVNLACAVMKLGKVASDLPKLHGWLVKRREEHLRRIASMTEDWSRKFNRLMHTDYVEGVERRKKSGNSSSDASISARSAFIGASGPLPPPVPSAERLVEEMRQVHRELWRYLNMCEHIGIEQEPAFLKAKRLTKLDNRPGAEVDDEDVGEVEESLANFAT